MAMYHLVLLCALHLTLALGEVRGHGRGRRSDDSGPLQSVVEGLSQKVDQLTAQSTAQAALITQLQSRLGAAEVAVGFTAKFSQTDITGLGSGQILRFDRVLYNAGNGYSPVSGIFTAPVAGTYAFYMNIAQHSGDDGSCIQMDLMHGNTWLLTADACDHYLNTGSNLAVIHLQAGDTVHVQMHRGSRLHGDYHTSFSGMRLSFV